jgi:Asp-tRNA(Asn)/Glu-tRNA(Gln) amidotransferase A subunit family amidase
MDLSRAGVCEIVRGISERKFTAVDVVQSCMARIRDRDAHLRAWTVCDADAALGEAANLPGNPALPLRGVPFGVKDVLDTAALPTEMGSRLYAGHRPRFDAGIVAQTRAAGGVLLGKTATCEFAGTEPAPTLNPLDPTRTPGGSSSGSAAAVADLMVPLAFGTQTGGSVLRPAAFCGIVGFKPTFGFYTIAGMKPAAHSFDTIGFFVRSAEDAAAVHEALMAIPAGTIRPPGGPPRIGILKTHLDDTVGGEAASALTAAIEAFGAVGALLARVESPPEFATITQQRAVINAYERARGLMGEWQADPSLMGEKTAALYRNGLKVTGTQYVAARRAVERFRTDIEQVFTDCDVLLTVTTPGVAPHGLMDTGDPRLQELWTMLHMPSIALPAPGTELPTSIQLIARRFDDPALLSSAIWAQNILREQGR